MPGRSGGWNKLTADEHAARGTFRKDRADRYARPFSGPALSAADRRRTLQGLGADARRIAVSLLSTYDGWDASGLVSLRAYAASCERLERFRAEGGKELYKELRANLALLKALNFEAAR